MKQIVTKYRREQTSLKILLQIKGEDLVGHSAPEGRNRKLVITWGGDKNNQSK